MERKSGEMVIKGGLNSTLIDKVLFFVCVNEGNYCMEFRGNVHKIEERRNLHEEGNVVFIREMKTEERGANIIYKTDLHKK